MSVNNTNRSILANYLLGQGSSAVQGKNYVKNSFGMNGTSNVSVSGTATVAKNTTTPLTGISDFAITLPNNTTDYVEFALDTLDNSLKNQNCQLTFDYKIASLGSAVQAQVLINGVVNGSQVLSATPAQASLSLNVLCGDLTNSTTIRISNVTGNSGTSSLNVANMNYGRATNIGTVSQARLLGGVKVTGCAGSWQRAAAGSTLVAYTAQTGCTYATFGSAVADTSFGSTQLPSIKFTSMPAGDYRIEYEGTIGANGTNGTVQTNQFTDGTITAREISTTVEGPVATGMYPGISQSFTYTDPKSNVTWQLFSAVSDANNTQVFGTTAKPGVFKVWYFPSSSQQAVTPEQQRAPTIQTLTSGTTYTRPNGVTFLKIRMVGGGGGGAGGAQNSFGGAGGAGGNTTFSTFLTANGGSGGATHVGGSGGTATISSPAYGTALSGGSGGGGTSATLNVTPLPAGGTGASSPFGGAGGSRQQGVGFSAIANSGSGAGGGGIANTVNGGSGAGGGAGGYIEAIIPNPASTYSYSIPSGGTAGTAGTSGFAGGVGGSGFIEVTEYYSQTAPILVGSVTSNSSGAERIERSGMSSAGVASKQSTPNWISCTAQSSGSSTCTFAANTFSATPVCMVNDIQTGSRYCAANTYSGTTSFQVQCYVNGSTPDNNAYDILCMGPR